jgi:hypothetical protein
MIAEADAELERLRIETQRVLAVKAALSDVEIRNAHLPVVGEEAIASAHALGVATEPPAEITTATVQLTARETTFYNFIVENPASTVSEFSNVTGHGGRGGTAYYKVAKDLVKKGWISAVGSLPVRYTAIPE